MNYSFKFPCITVEEVYFRTYLCARGGGCAGAGGPDDRSWTSENLGFSSQTAQREGDLICEGSLGRGNPGNDVGDGRCHEEVLSSPIPW